MYFIAIVFEIGTFVCILQPWYVRGYICIFFTTIEFESNIRVSVTAVVFDSSIFFCILQLWYFRVVSCLVPAVSLSHIIPVRMLWRKAGPFSN